MTRSLCPVSRFGIEPLGAETAKARLLDQGRVTDTIVSGRILEAQYAWNGCFILLTTDDTPYEERLNIIMLDDRCQVLDQIELGRAYRSGAVQALAVIGADGLEFTFFGGDRWRLQIEDQGRRRWQVSPLATVRYPGPPWRAHYLSLTRIA